MKKFWIIFLIFVTFIANVSAAVSQEDLARALEKAKPIFHEYTVPQKFRQAFIALFWEAGYDKINAGTMTDYSVLNTNKIWKIFTKNSFIHFPKNCGENQVAKGVNKNGEIICGARLSNILVNVRVTDGTGIIENTKTKEKKNLQKNDTFTVTDKVMLSTTDKSLEIAFADNSIIRLETDTKISLSGIKDHDGIRTLAEASYDRGLLWGRVVSPDGPSFRHGEIIAWVRGTSIAMTSDSIYALQSQHHDSAVTIQKSGNTTNMWECSQISITNPDKANTINNGGERCMGAKISYAGRDDIVRENTKKDIAYLNTLIAENKANNHIEKERNIAWPQKIERNRDFCQNDTPVFWPNVLDASQMCQEENVYAVVTRKENENPILYYLSDDEVEVVTGKKPQWEFYKKNPQLEFYEFEINEKFKENFERYFVKKVEENKKVSLWDAHPIIRYWEQEYTLTNKGYTGEKIWNNNNIVIYLKGINFIDFKK